jgi:glutamate-1-semialdehyde aminotransferase
VEKDVIDWQYAKTIIPQGNGLLSKRKEVRSANWPGYYSMADGCEVGLSDGRWFYDFNIMGVGCCVLGYNDLHVNNAVYDAIRSGNMCTLNCPEEVELAELLLKLNPKMDMVRFSRMGGDAMAQAVRVARAYTGKEKVIIRPGGYHGWHDWYQASGQNGQPMGGIPKCLGDVVGLDYPMGEVAAVVVEPDQVESVWLRRLRDLCTEGNIPLIFDEITSGFRLNCAGVHQVYGVIPDMVVYGKAMGNGYPIYAILGKREIMEAYEKTFVSSTMNTERTGFAAGIATIEKMHRLDVPDHLIKTGKAVKRIWQEEAEENSLQIEITEIDPLATFQFTNDSHLTLMTLYTQEMVKWGFLASSQFRASYAHKPEHVCQFDVAVQAVFKDMADGSAKLEGPPAQGGVRK